MFRRTVVITGKLFLSNINDNGWDRIPSPLNMNNVVFYSLPRTRVVQAERRRSVAKPETYCALHVQLSLCMRWANFFNGGNKWGSWSASRCPRCIPRTELQLAGREVSDQKNFFVRNLSRNKAQVYIKYIWEVRTISACLKKQGLADMN